MAEDYTFKPAVALLDALFDAYDLDPAEEELVYRIARTVERLDRLDAELLAAKSLIVSGSTGQAAAHPLLRAIAEQERNLAALIAALKLPDAADPSADLPESVTRLSRRRVANG